MDWSSEKIELADKLEILDGFIETMQALLDIMNNEPEQVSTDIERVTKHRDILLEIKQDLNSLNYIRNEYYEP